MLNPLMDDDAFADRTAGTDNDTDAYRFHFNPASYIDKSRLSSLAAPGITEAMVQALHPDPVLSRVIFKKFDLTLTPVVSVEAGLRRVVLCSPPELETLSLYTGLVLISDSLKAVIDRAQLRQMREEFGQEAITFARTYDGEKADFRGLRTVPLTRCRRTHLCGWGLALIIESLGRLDAALKRRFFLKFSEDDIDNATNPPFNPADVPVFWPHVAERSLPECFRRIA